MVKRLALFLDGTWNKPDDNTNVWRTKLMLADRDDAGTTQLSYYDSGVGTRWYNRRLGGLFGVGLEKNIREAYLWLMEHYAQGDEVFVFGFSRGAYTARSLVGMIARCGLLSPGAPMSVPQVFERYRRGREETPLYELEFRHRNRPDESLTLEEQWLLQYSKRVKIKFIGVWDTVGALGIPIGALKFLTRKRYYFHNTRLSVIIENAYHALAVDEHREPYAAALWTRYEPKEPGAGSPSQETVVEQRWFIGAHSNIGGGYRNDLLAQVPLAWMQGKAREHGLAFRELATLGGYEHRGTITDSYARFLKGAYRVVKLGRRHHRRIGAPPEEKDDGWVETANETIDGTVIDRWRKDASYRPGNLVDWAKRNEDEIKASTGAVKARRDRRHESGPREAG